MKKPPAPDDRPSSRPAGTRPSTGVVVDRETVELKRLEKRIGRVHLQQRLGIEADHATQIFGRGRTVFHIENWYSIHALIRLTLRCLGLYGWGVRNATSIQIRHNEVVIPHLPAAFDGLTLLHLSDLHLDMADGYPAALIERLQQVQYDFCVMTGDFRAKTFGDYQAALAALAQVRDALHGPIYAVLGNHDSIRMTPGIEALGITLLLNEAVALELDGEVIHLAGIDDPHYFQVDNFDKAAQHIPPDSTAILLSHSPEPYQRAAHAGFDLMLSGHTHGGQICLPGGVALMTNADCPRRFCKGAWRYHAMQGYTSVGSGASVVGVRFNCPPEITLHHLRSGSTPDQ
ncbi:metallophosphoesterase [Candidatus Contendibacter odensensis]|uniref:Metallophosphoesterase n=1 Tax=Candidatus Contendobacter odensis Run_B_J11 TaxID=1400861 RepID=A0A7U7GCK4_9GAMM|nr:metallophosphoesterase [Candidatus Contendobacter odensis]MBK8752035.1 metallophosphoesterase family protein [Candidatus Competibacteraceae bacterium]CDH45767.1 Metallophosphoesterase [Candidatus Contendobacter odensis Run_B_J11]